MSRKSPLPQDRHHVMIYNEDWEFLQENYGPGSIGYKLGVSGAIKVIIHAHIKRLRARSAEAYEEIRRAQEGHQPEPAAKVEGTGL